MGQMTLTVGQFIRPSAHLVVGTEHQVLLK